MMTLHTHPLRNDRGDASPVALVMGSILTLIAALIIGGALTTMLGATSIAQSNSDLTTLMEREIRTFEQTPFSKLTEETPHKYQVTVNKRKVSIEREVFYNTEQRSYTLRLTAPRAVMANKPPLVCSSLDATGKTPKGCFSLSASIVGTPADLGPVLPTGITVSVRNVDGGNKSANLVAFDDFEQDGAAAAWGATGSGATIETNPKPRLTGTKELVLTKNTVIYSQPIAGATGDNIKSQVWAQVSAGSAQVSVGTAAGAASPIYGTSVSGNKWNLASVTTSLTSNSSYRVAIRVTSCSAGCKIRIDDTSSLRLVENLVRDPSKHKLEGGMTYTAATDTFGTNGSLGQKALRYNFDATTMKGINKLTFGARVAATATPADATGSIRIIYRPASGPDSELPSINIAGIGTSSVPIAGIMNFTPAAGGQFIIAVNQQAGAAKPINISNVTLTATGRVNPEAVDAPSMEVARIDAKEVKDTALRVSYQYDGNVLPEDLRIGVFCTTDLGTGSLSTNRMYLSQDTQNRNWYWSRLEIPELDRLDQCPHANIRVWSQSGSVIESSLVRNVSVMKVLDGIIARNHGKDDGEE